MQKLDLAKIYTSYYTAKTTPELVEFAKATYLSIRGKGDPSEKPFAARIETLYPVAYTLKFLCKARGKDFVVPKLEGQWWYDERKYPGRDITKAVEIPRSEWEYRLLIRLPDFITRNDFDEALAQAIIKKKLPLAGDVAFFEMEEGRCVQMLHVGPFSTEIESLKVIDAFSRAHNLVRNGLHHEIYLSDFRKTPPEKLRTILRELVK